MWKILILMLTLWPQQIFASDFLVQVKPQTEKKIQILVHLPRVRDNLFLVPKSQISQFKNRSWVEHIEPNHKIYLYELPSDLGERQWWHENKLGFDISSTKAWSKATGSKDVVVAVLDSGVDDQHEDLKNNLWKNEAELNGAPGVDDDNNGFVDDFQGWGFYADTNDIFDYRGHGTHVAGIIGAEGNNGLGVTGVNWSVTIMALNIFPRYIEGRVSDAIRGIDYAVANGADIINASWGATPQEIKADEYQFLREAIERANNAGVLFVTAAGNSSASNEKNGSVPASFGLRNIISVGSMDRYGEPSDFTNYGKTSVHVFAPGTEVYSTLPKSKYGYKSGTSMASPVVAGVAALLLANEPNLSTEEVKTRILGSCNPLSTLKDLCACNGSIDAEKVLSK